MSKSQKITFSISLIAVLSISFIQSGANAVNSVLPMMIETFSEYSATTVRLVSTLPSLVSMTVGLIVGATVGKKVKYKTYFLLGSLLFVIGGTGPAFFHDSLPLILAFRAVFGCAAGCFSIVNAYILSTVEISQQARVIGFAAMIANIGAAIMQVVSGPLADYHWPYAFYPYFLGLISLFMILFLMKEPVIEKPAKTGDSDISKQPLNKKVYLYGFFQFFVSCTAMPVIVGMGTVIVGRNLGGDSVGTIVSIILCVCQIGGVITGAIFGKYVETLGRFTMPVAMFIQGLGIFLILIAPHVVVIGIGATVSGIGTILIGSLCNTYIGHIVPKDRIPMTTVVIMLLAQIAIFISTYYIAACHLILGSRFGTDAESSYAVGSILYIIMIILTLIFNVNPKESENIN